jgi:hypothetical protein
MIKSSIKSIDSVAVVQSQSEWAKKLGHHIEKNLFEQNIEDEVYFSALALSAYEARRAFRAGNLSPMVTKKTIIELNVQAQKKIKAAYSDGTFANYCAERRRF